MANIPSIGSIKTSLGNLCLPSQIYLGLSVLALIFATLNSFSIITIFVKVIFIGLWTFILNWICQKGYESISWALVVLPYVLLILMFLLGVEIIDKKINKVTGENKKPEKRGEKNEK
jgi:F0F1-type ATP synthase assembly protein I